MAFHLIHSNEEPLMEGMILGHFRFQLQACTSWVSRDTLQLQSELDQPLMSHKNYSPKDMVFYWLSWWNQLICGCRLTRSGANESKGVWVQKRKRAKNNLFGSKLWLGVMWNHVLSLHRKRENTKHNAAMFRKEQLWHSIWRDQIFYKSNINKQILSKSRIIFQISKCIWNSRLNGVFDAGIIFMWYNCTNKKGAKVIKFHFLMRENFSLQNPLSRLKICRPFCCNC